MRFWLGALALVCGALIAAVRLITGSGWDAWWILGNGLFVVGLVFVSLEARKMRRWLDQKEREHGLDNTDQMHEAQDVTKHARHRRRTSVQPEFAREREVLHAYAQERGLPFVDLDRVQLDRNVLAAVPLHVLQEHRCIPLKRRGDELWVAMSGPENLAAIDGISAASGCKVFPAVAVPSAIDEVLQGLQ